jgi:5'(3')-deoxyribonucleotidase
MRGSDLLKEWGRIVKGVNTTADVGPGEIKKQAAKFGNTVDKDGKPPTLSKKVKGSKTNVLFNLGLAEGIILRLERDKHIDVLHIMDTNKKHRVEVRGKKGYESGNYDAQDKLHQVLDRVGKAANISELINGETVSINPNHPQGTRAIRTAKDVLQTEEKRFTEMELACIEGGHDLNDLYEKAPEPKPTGDLFNALSETYNSRDSLIEALGEIAPNTEIYVDMDGVLADFFGEWSKSQGVGNWKDIENPAQAIGDIKTIDNFWLNLPVLPQATQLLSLIKKVKGRYKICTSPLADDPRSEPHKRQWVKDNLDFFPPDEVIVTHNKPQFATQKDGTPNILIDDYGVNINAWEEAGGIGFKYKDHKFERTAKALQQHVQEPVENYTRDQLPQIRQKNLKNIRHTIETIAIKDIIPVQKERIIENFKRQVDRIVAGKYTPIIVDCNNKIVNGHHRYTALEMLGYDKVEVAKLPLTIKQIVENFADDQREKTKRTLAKHDKAMIKVARDSIKKYEKDKEDKETNENFADGKKKGKSRPGRVKKSGASCNGSVTSLRKKAKKASGERAKMYHWCANMKAGRKKK